MRYFATIALYSLLSVGLFAANTPPESIKEVSGSTGAPTGEEINGIAQDSIAVSETKKYTFGDFFDALDLPTVLGVGVTPNGIEGVTFNSSMRLGWRHHKSYGVYVFISYDTHSNSYESLSVGGTNVRSGEVWYNEIGLGVGYRIPLVKDIRAFYEKPYFNHWDFFVSVEPGVSIPKVKNVVPYDDGSLSEGEATYQLKDQLSTVPTLRFAAGVEWFIVHNFGVFAEAAYVQHLTPTVIEKAAMEKGMIKAPSGPIVLSIGLSLFFN